VSRVRVVETEGAGLLTESLAWYSAMGDDLVEVGVFAAAEDGGSGEPLYLRMHRIRSGKQRGGNRSA
jgi:hypothetical protein